MHSRTSDDAGLEALARAAQQGDRAALERLARAVYPRVHRWALVYAGNRSDADDIVQDALLLLVRNLASFRFESRVTTWLYRITRRAAAETRRRARRHDALQDRARHSPSPRSVAPRADVERLDHARARQSVQTHFARLPARQREIFDLADVQSIPLVDIAERLGLEAVTVRVHLLRARRALRARVLAEHPAIAEDMYGLPNRT